MGQYIHFYNSVFQDLNSKEISFGTAHVGIGEADSLGVDFKKRMYHGIVAIDILKKMVYKTRPYERENGSTDRLYLK